MMPNNQSQSPQVRRSQRIRELTLKSNEIEQKMRMIHNAKAPNKDTPKINTKSVIKMKPKPVSILKSASKMRGRSKSVAFDSNIVSPVRRVAPVRRNLFGNPNRSLQADSSSKRVRSKSIDSIVVPSVRQRVDGRQNRQSHVSDSSDLPLDLTVSSPTAHRINLARNDSTENQTNATGGQQHDVAIQCMIGQTVALDARAYEARIDALVQCNEAKIDRIKEIRGERDLLLNEKEAFLAEIDTLHRINRIMGETIDAYQATEAGMQPTIDQSVQIEQLNGNVQLLKDRVRRLNAENFELHASNDRLMTCLLSHSKDIMKEHNYNM